jgi:hypothetical protein
VLAVFNGVDPTHRMVNARGVGRLQVGFLLCEINFSHTFRLTSKLCTVVMDILKMWMLLFGSVQTFFEKST